MISIASASVLDYYGKIEGSANVKGPTFYTSNENITDTFYKKLLINQPPTEEQKGEVSFIDGQSQSFGSNSLNVNSFYRPKFDFSIEAGVSEGERPLILEVYTWNPSTTETKEFICKAILNISSLGNYTTACSGNNTLSLSPSDGFLWEIKGGVGWTNITYTIYLNGNTKFEVSPA
jgi:hypothetical protein